ncbi:DUF1330 domain-containing protein [Microbulbifer sp. S227A]|uniref:DUF1330 domain-containing protein n=1 Tax=Microbulbifer sp. S227A TaxID=3415131 RepID=UPI003C7AECC4
MVLNIRRFWIQLLRQIVAGLFSSFPHPSIDNVRLTIRYDPFVVNREKPMMIRVALVATLFTVLSGCVSINVTDSGQSGYSNSCNRTAYLVHSGTLRSEGALASYRAAYAEEVEDYDGLVLTQQSPSTVVHGAQSGAEVLMLTRFPCESRAKDFWRSQTNTELAVLRDQAGDFMVAIYERGLHVNF